MSKNIYFVAVVALLIGCSNIVEDKRTETTMLTDHQTLQFVKGMKGAENILLDEHSSKVYTTDLSGFIYLVDGENRQSMQIVNSLKIGKRVLGVVNGKDGYLYVVASQYDEENWLELGGEIYQVDKKLETYTKITGNIKGINGLSFDSNGDLFFTAGNLSLFFPKGKIYKMPYNQALNKFDPPEIFLDDLGSANGLVYSEFYNALVVTETFSKVSLIVTQSKTLTTVLDKTKLVEGFDDLCTDSQGRFWVAEPVDGFMKMYDPKDKKLVRFHIEGVGMASSCRIRMDDNNEEVIYITERQFDEKDDGRGLIIVPLKELENL